MKVRKAKPIVALTLVGAAVLTLGERAAHADTSGVYTGYICNVFESMTAGQTGAYGWLSVSMYSGPECTGSYLGTPTFASTGGTVCTSLVPQLSETRAQAVEHNLVLAASQNLRATLNYSVPTSGWPACVYSYQIYGK
jgi:hypothetical protein